MTQSYDIIIFGGGIAGLYAANRLQQAGYNLILVEKDRLGTGQTLASQGMIHGGQKYVLHGSSTGPAESIAQMPARWDACFAGKGDIDLSNLKFLSNTQIMFPAGSFLSNVTAFAAAKAVNGKTQKLKKEQIPAFLKRDTAYEMQEKVLDTKSLLATLAKNLKGRIVKGEASEILPDGSVVVSGITLKAQMIIFTAGIGNETALKLLQEKEQRTQRRPLRQIMVKSLPYALYGHGITSHPKPRVTITSHPLPDGQYIWYLGGNVSEDGVKMSETEALSHAKKEMKDVFPDIDWDSKEWASWYGERAEAFDAKGHLPPGPCVQQRGKVLITWPTKLTFVPALSDKIIDQIVQSGIKPSPVTPPPALPEAELGTYPWEEVAVWQRL